MQTQPQTRRSFLLSVGSSGVAGYISLSAKVALGDNTSSAKENIIGKTSVYVAKHEDTLLDIARLFGLGFVETVAAMKAQERSQGLQEELETIKEREQELKVQSAYRELLNNHPDFNEIKADEKFLTWLDEQPESISDGIYKNNTDARWASRVIDLYKADAGISKKKKTKSTEAAATAVRSPKAKDITSEASGDKKIWKASQIARMEPWEFEKVEAELDAARAEGRIDLNS